MANNKRLRVRDLELENFLLRVEKIFKTSMRDIVNAANSNLTIDFIFKLQDLETILIDAGLNNELQRLRKTYANELIDIREQFESLGIERSSIFTALDKEAIEVLVNSDLSNIGNSFRKIAGDFKGYITRSILVQEPIKMETVLDSLDSTLARQIKTEINTAMANFDRSVTVKKAVDIFGDNPIFEYVGVLDNLTRTFCRNLVGKQFTLKQIEQMNNGQGLPVLTNGGGWNCRHSWRIVKQ